MYSTAGPKLGPRNKLGRGAGRGKLGRKGEEPKEKDGSCNIHAVRCLLEKKQAGE